MPRYKTETVIHDDEEFQVRISELGARQNFTADLLISFGSDVSGDNAQLKINGAPFRFIDARMTNLSDPERRLVKFALEEAPRQLTPELAQRAISKIEEMFSLERPFVDEASTKRLPTEIQNMLSKQTMISKLQHDPMFYNNINAKARENPKYAMAAIRQAGELLNDAPPNIRNNKAIVIAAIRGYNDEAYAVASDALKADWDVICEAVVLRITALYQVFRFKPELFNDTKFIVHLLNCHHLSLLATPLPPESAEKRESKLMGFLSKLKAGVPLPMFSDASTQKEIIPHLDIARRAIIKYALILTSELQVGMDEDVALLFAEQGVLFVLPELYKANKEIVTASLEAKRRPTHFDSNFKYADDVLKGDKRYIRGLLMQGYYVFTWIHPDLQRDKDVAATLVRYFGKRGFQDLNDDLKQDTDILSELSLFSHNIGLPEDEGSE